MLHKQSVSPPRSSNRTCGFPASGSPTGFTAGMRRAFDTSVLSVSVPPWLHDTACSESFRNYAVLYRLAPSHPPSPSSTSTPEVRVLSSTGVTQLHRYTTLSDSRSSRCPTAPLRPLPSLSTGLPRLRDPRLDVPCPLPRWTGPGASVGCFPRSCCLPRTPGGSASTTSLSRPAQASFTLRPVELLARPRRTLSQGFDPADYSTEPPASYRANRPLPGWDLHPQGDRPLRGATEFHGEEFVLALRALVSHICQSALLRNPERTPGNSVSN